MTRGTDDTWQVWMKKECESFAAGVDAVDIETPSEGGGWWEGLDRQKDKPLSPRAEASE